MRRNVGVVFQFIHGAAQMRASGALGVAFCFWDPELQLQVRMTGEAFIEESDAGDTNWVFEFKGARTFYRHPKTRHAYPASKCLAYGGKRVRPD